MRRERFFCVKKRESKKNCGGGKKGMDKTTGEVPSRSIKRQRPIGASAPFLDPRTMRLSATRAPIINPILEQSGIETGAKNKDAQLPCQFVSE